MTSVGRALVDEVVDWDDDGTATPGQIHNDCMSRAHAHYMAGLLLVEDSLFGHGPVQHVIAYRLTRRAELLAHCALIEAAYPHSEDF